MEVQKLTAKEIMDQAIPRDSKGEPKSKWQIKSDRQAADMKPKTRIVCGQCGRAGGILVRVGKKKSGSYAHKNMACAPRRIRPTGRKATVSNVKKIPKVAVGAEKIATPN